MKKGVFNKEYCTKNAPLIRNTAQKILIVPNERNAIINSSIVKIVVIFGKG